jgi:hypothetical protein
MYAIKLVGCDCFPWHPACLLELQPNTSHNHCTAALLQADCRWAIQLELGSRWDGIVAACSHPVPSQRPSFKALVASLAAMCPA